MPQQELLIRVAQTLERVRIGYMVTGSVASSLHGEPRSTHDIDIIVSISIQAIKALVASFPSPEFFLDELSIKDAVFTRSMFNLINAYTGDKVDFWILTDDPFDQSRFSRRYYEEIAGVGIAFSSPEDTILSKLRWSQLSGGSERQYQDALHIYELQCNQLDHAYLRHWAKELQCETLLDRIENQAEI